MSKKKVAVNAQVLMAELIDDLVMSDNEVLQLAGSMVKRKTRNGKIRPKNEMIQEVSSELMNKILVFKGVVTKVEEEVIVKKITYKLADGAKEPYGKFMRSRGGIIEMNAKEADRFKILHLRDWLRDYMDAQDG